MGNSYSFYESNIYRKLGNSIKLKLNLTFQIHEVIQIKHRDQIQLIIVYERTQKYPPQKKIFITGMQSWMHFCIFK